MKVNKNLKNYVKLAKTIFYIALLSVIAGIWGVVTSAPDSRNTYIIVAIIATGVAVIFVRVLKRLDDFVRIIAKNSSIGL